MVTIAAMGARARMRRVAGVAVLAGWLLSLASIAALPSLVPPIAVTAMMAAIGAMAWGLWRAQAHTAWRDVVCRRDGLTIYTGPAVIELPRDALAEGVVRQSALSWQLRVTARDGVRYDVDTPDGDTAQRWLAALGLDAGARAVRVVTNRPLAQGVFAYFVGGFFAMPLTGLTMLVTSLFGRQDSVGMSLAMTYLAMLPAYWFAARSVGHVDITIGADGLYAGRGWRRTFVPIYGVHSVEAPPSSPETVALRLHSGEVRTYRMETRGDALAVVQRVRDVLALHQMGLPDAVQRALSAQGPATPEAWRDVFVDAVRGATYRDVSLSLDDLTRVLSAPSATPAQRLGAAMAVRALDGASPVTRVRVAVELVADPAMQQALEAAAQAVTAPAARAASR